MNSNRNFDEKKMKRFNQDIKKRGHLQKRVDSIAQ